MIFSSCTDEWENHYKETSEGVDINLWTALKSKEQYSEFVKYIEQFKLDTFIQNSHAKTLFIPTNESFTEYFKSDTTGFKKTIYYHIVPTFFVLRSVEGKRKLQTLSEKYALIESFRSTYFFDGCEITGASQLFMNGKYYEISEVVKPSPNLYEYIKLNNPPISKYIDLQDTVILDLDKSKPLGYNERGQLIYDSVTTITNHFEEEYFAISKEHRDFSATLVIPDQTNYEAALDEMAQKLGGTFSSHEDIPAKWQNESLIPILLNKGTYGGLKDHIDFKLRKVANIKGDSIKTDFEINPDSRIICSNGLIYNYASFSVGDSLYLENIIEGEALCDEIGLNRFAWNEKVNVERDESFQPVISRVRGASNDTVVNVEFSSNYLGKYSVAFKMKNVFPTNYRLVWRTNYRTPGEYAIYVNGEKVKLGLTQQESYDTYNLRDGFFSVLGYKLYRDDKGFCDVDGWVNNITEFGDVTIKIEYIGPGQGSQGGLSIDYIALLAK